MPVAPRTARPRWRRARPGSRPPTAGATRAGHRASMSGYPTGADTHLDLRRRGEPSRLPVAAYFDAAGRPYPDLLDVPPDGDRPLGLVPPTSSTRSWMPPTRPTPGRWPASPSTWRRPPTGREREPGYVSAVASGRRRRRRRRI